MEFQFQKAPMIPFRVSDRLGQRLAKAAGNAWPERREKFVRSSGRGGQKVNKTSTCVYLKHIPTGIEVKCMKERSQSLNRFLARRELIEKIEKLSGQITSKDLKIRQMRRQKLKRGKRAKLKYGIGKGK